MNRDVYSQAGQIIDESLKRRVSLKSCCYKSKYPNKKLLLLLVLKSMSYKTILDVLIDKVVRGKIELSYGILLVILYEHLFGKRHRNRVWRDLISPFDSQLRKEMHLYMQINNIPTKKSLSLETPSIPRCVRVNTLKMGVQDAIRSFQKLGFCLVDQEFNSRAMFTEREASLKANEFLRDPLFSNLLCFSANTDFHDLDLVVRGCVVLQDKASCIPAVVLNPRPESVVLDCCAAPGNKASQLCEIMSNQGLVIANDIDPRRLQLMTEFLGKRNCKCRITNIDFLKIDPLTEPFNRVEFILFDPSCSSSGMVKIQNTFVSKGNPGIQNSALLANKASFQKAALNHALSFPKLDQLVYSTCSIFAEENEEVVKDALANWSQRFRLEHIFGEWPCRGLESFGETGRKCIRACPTLTNTNGFFVAKFARISHN